MILIRTAGGKSADFPSSWDELTPRQVRHVWRLQNRCLRSGGSPLELSVSILLYLLGIRRLPRARGGLLRENLYMLCDRCLGFMFPEDGAALQYTSTVNPMPCIGFRRGPADLLQNLTFGEFRHAAAALQAYARSHDAADLDECVALLWRTPIRLKANRAGRRCASPGGLAFRLDLKLAKRTSAWRKSLAFAWFCSAMQYLQTGRLVIDGETVDLSLLFSSSGSSHGPECGWNDLLVQIARDGILGNIDMVDKEPLMSILSIMWCNYKESKRYEETLKAHKSK